MLLLLWWRLLWRRSPQWRPLQRARLLVRQLCWCRDRSKLWHRGCRYKWWRHHWRRWHSGWWRRQHGHRRRASRQRTTKCSRTDLIRRNGTIAIERQRLVTGVASAVDCADDRWRWHCIGPVVNHVSLTGIGIVSWSRSRAEHAKNVLPRQLSGPTILLLWRRLYRRRKVLCWWRSTHWCRWKSFATRAAGR